MPNPSAGQNGRPRARLRLAVRLPTVDSNTEPTVNSAPSGVFQSPRGLAELGPEDQRDSGDAEQAAEDETRPQVDAEQRAGAESRH